MTPNSEKCFIIVDGEKCVWRDGEAIMFDETYIHTAENQTDQNRIILFCDVERPLRTRAMRAVNRWVSRHIIKESATENEAGERHGNAPINVLPSRSGGARGSGAARGPHSTTR